MPGDLRHPSSANCGIREDPLSRVEDRPGVLAQITQGVANAGINIDDIRSPHNDKGDRSIAVLKVSEAVSDSVIEEIKGQANCEIGCYVHF